MNERVRLDETSHPVDIKIRRILKGIFLDELTKALKRSQFPREAQIVIYGSTIMRQFVEEDGIEFPYAGIKSSDIDIGCHMVGHHYGSVEKTFYAEHVSPILREAVINSGFDLWAPPSGTSIPFSETKSARKYRNSELAALPESFFRGDFYAVKLLSHDRIEELLKDDPDFDKIRPYLDEHFLTKKRPEKTICLSISSHDEHFPLIVTPVPLFPNRSGRAEQLCRATRYDMLAGKIARSMGGNYKPTDIIDIYNLIKGVNSKGEPVLRIDPKDPNNELDLVRFLAINYLLCGYSYFDIKSPTLLSKFIGSEENKADFKTKTEHQLVEFQKAGLYDNLDEVFSTVESFIRYKIFDRRTQGVSTGPLNLTFAEVQYISQFQGRKASVPEPVQESSWKRIFRTSAVQENKKEVVLGYRTENEKDGNNRCFMNLSVLEDQYGNLFRRRPDIPPSIKSNALLEGKLQQNNYGYAAGML